MYRYASPVNPASYPIFSILLLSIGIFFVAWFVVYEVTANKFVRHLFKEFALAIMASLFMSFGAVFLLLWFGIYV